MLQNLMEHVGATQFVEVALVLFVAVFLSVLLREALRSKREVRHLAELPLEDNARIDE